MKFINALAAGVWTSNAVWWYFLGSTRHAALSLIVASIFGFIALQAPRE